MLLSCNSQSATYTCMGQSVRMLLTFASCRNKTSIFLQIKSLWKGRLKKNLSGTILVTFFLAFCNSLCWLTSTPANMPVGLYELGFRALVHSWGCLMTSRTPERNVINESQTKSLQILPSTGCEESIATVNYSDSLGGKEN